MVLRKGLPSDGRSSGQAQAGHRAPWQHPIADPMAPPSLDIELHRFALEPLSSLGFGAAMAANRAKC